MARDPYPERDSFWSRPIEWKYWLPFVGILLWLRDFIALDEDRPRPRPRQPDGERSTPTWLDVDSPRFYFLLAVVTAIGVEYQFDVGPLAHLFAQAALWLCIALGRVTKDELNDPRRRERKHRPRRP